MAQSKADAELRVQAMKFAVDTIISTGNTGTLLETAASIFAFLSGDDSAPSTTQRTSTRGKADAPDTGSENASSPSSDKPAASTAASTADEKPKDDQTTQQNAGATGASPSDKGAGFAADGSEITKDDIIKKAMEYSATPSLGQAKFVALLDEYGSANISGLDTARYAEFIAALQSGIDEAKAMA